MICSGVVSPKYVGQAMTVKSPETCVRVHVRPW